MRPIWAKKSHKNNSVNRRTSNERLFSPHLGAYTSQKSEESYNDSKICVFEESIGINAPDIGQKSHKNNSVDNEQAMREISIFSTFGGVCEPKK
jgi:hypothetical protein